MCLMLIELGCRLFHRVWSLILGVVIVICVVTVLECFVSALVQLLEIMCSHCVKAETRCLGVVSVVVFSHYSLGVVSVIVLSTFLGVCNLQLEVKIVNNLRDCLQLMICL